MELSNDRWETLLMMAKAVDFNSGKILWDKLNGMILISWLISYSIPYTKSISRKPKKDLGTTEIFASATKVEISVGYRGLEMQRHWCNAIG